jgi:alpha-amylase
VSDKNVELLAEPYSSGLAAWLGEGFWEEQIKKQQEKLKKVFGKEASVLMNTNLVYSDEIGLRASKMGFTGIITEGAKHILGWKSPRYIYSHPSQPKLKLALRDREISEDILFRFEEKKYNVNDLLAALSTDGKDDTHTTLVLDYAIFGLYQREESGILEFLKALPEQVSSYKFVTPSELFAGSKSVASLHIPDPISALDEEKDLTPFIGNDLQRDAFETLQRISKKIHGVKDSEIVKDFVFLTGIDHLYFMSTKWFTAASTPRYIRPYDSPYEAYINFMNVLADLEVRILNYMKPTNKNINQKISKIMEEKKVVAAKSAAKKPAVKKAVAKKPAAKKPAVKKVVAKKPTVKKAVAKKPAVKKVVAKKPTVKKAVAKKPAVKKVVAKKPAVKKAVAKKPAAKKPVVKKVVAKKPVAKKK